MEGQTRAPQGSSFGFGASLGLVSVIVLMSDWASFERLRIAALLGTLVGLGAAAHLLRGRRPGDPWDRGGRVGVAAFVLTVVGLNLPRCILMLLQGPGR